MRIGDVGFVGWLAGWLGDCAELRRNGCWWLMDSSQCCVVLYSKAVVLSCPACSRLVVLGFR